MFRFIKNMFTIPDIRKRVIFTLVMLAVYRIGAHIPVPFVDVQNIQEQFTNQLFSGLFSMADMFTGGALGQMSILALGVMPYISASIILQMLMVVWPRLEKLKKEGESGQKKINQYTRLSTVGLSALQGLGLGIFITKNPDWVAPFMRDNTLLFLFIATVSVAAGTTFLMWMGEKITELGVGNGISLLIAFSIIQSFPNNILITIQNLQLEAFPPIWIFIIAGLMVATTIVIVMIQEGARKIPIQHAKQMVGRRGMTTGQTNYLPLKVNTAGVMPVIFSSAIMMLPTTIFGWIGAGATGGGLAEWFSQTSRYNLYNLFDIEKGSILLLLRAMNINMLMFIVLTGFFCFFYTAITFNPRDVADNLRRAGAFIPGYRPGQQTADYIDKVMTRITVVGAIFLITVAIIPQLLFVSFQIPFGLAQFAGGTGLIIVVGVVLQTMQQLESQMLMRHYDGFTSRRQGAGGRRRVATKPRRK